MRLTFFIRVALAVALVLGTRASSQVLSVHDYLGAGLYFTGLSVLTSNINRYALLLVPSFGLLYLAVTVWRRPRGVHEAEAASVRGGPGWAGTISGLLVSAFAIVFVLLNLSVWTLYARNVLALRRQPNIVFIMVDTLRADHVGAYGYGRDTTPNIDSLAADGMRFERAISQAPWTLWSVGSFMTSVYPQVLDLGTVIRPQPLEDNRTTMAEILRDRGYRTYAATSNIFTCRKVNLHQGFDVYDESMCAFDTTSSGLADLAIKEIDRMKREKGRSFMFLLFIDPHDPYYKREGFDFLPEYRGRLPDRLTPSNEVYAGGGYSAEDLRHIVALYDSEIAYTDHHIGMVLSHLKNSDLYRDSLIILLSDHGEEFVEHGNFNHGTKLYNELINVPLIVKLPRQEQGRVIGGKYPLIDLLPSVLANIGINPLTYPFQGVKVELDLVRSSPDRSILSATRYQNQELRAILDDHYKLIRDLNSERRQLFDMNSDPAEKINLARSQAQVAETLDQRLGSKLAAAGGTVKRQRVDPERMFVEEEKERLRALGYMQ